MIVRRGIGQVPSDVQQTNPNAPAVVNCSGILGWIDPFCWNLSTPAPNTYQYPTLPPTTQTPTPPVGYDPNTGTINTQLPPDAVATSPYTGILGQIQQAIANANTGGASDTSGGFDWGTWLPVIAVGAVGFLLLGQAFGRGGRRR